MKLPRSYLSIDLDFWNRNNVEPGLIRRSVKRGFDIAFMERVLSSHKSVYVVVEHQHLLPHIARYPCGTLINMDAHDDICAIKGVPRGCMLPDVNCGTWVSFVDWPIKREYIWVHPYTSRVLTEVDIGRCDTCVDVYQPDQAGKTGWETVIERPKLLSSEHLNAVVAFGISISPAYCNVEHLKVFLKLMQRYHLILQDRAQFLHDMRHSYLYQGFLAGRILLNYCK